MDRDNYRGIMDRGIEDNGNMDINKDKDKYMKWVVLLIKVFLRAIL